SARLPGCRRGRSRPDPAIARAPKCLRGPAPGALRLDARGLQRRGAGDGAEPLHGLGGRRQLPRRCHAAQRPEPHGGGHSGDCQHLGDLQCRAGGVGDDEVPRELDLCLRVAAPQPRQSAASTPELGPVAWHLLVAGKAQDEEVEVEVDLDAPEDSEDEEILALGVSTIFKREVQETVRQLQAKLEDLVYENEVLRDAFAEGNLRSKSLFWALHPPCLQTATALWAGLGTDALLSLRHRVELASGPRSFGDPD
ncbi:unnamed protein product, partial [Polarella glacialis]